MNFILHNLMVLPFVTVFPLAANVLGAQTGSDAVSAEVEAISFVALTRYSRGTIAFDNKVVPMKLSDGQTRAQHDADETTRIANALDARVAKLNDVFICNADTKICGFDGVTKVVSVSRAQLSGATAQVVVVLNTQTEAVQRTRKSLHMQEFLVRLELKNNAWVVMSAEVIAES